MLRNQPGEPGLERRLAVAQELYAAHGAALRGDPEISRLLIEYLQSIGRSQAMMQRHGVFAACAECAGTHGGASCCFAGAEEWYGELLLLINLLLGVELPVQGDGGQDCFFNGPQGCRLTAHFAICLNFFCPELTQRLGPDRLARLRRQVGRELIAGQVLEGALLGWFRGQGVAVSL